MALKIFSFNLLKLIIMTDTTVQINLMKKLLNIYFLIHLLLNSL
jgi:hypothetical protein